MTDELIRQLGEDKDSDEAKNSDHRLRNRKSEQNIVSQINKREKYSRLISVGETLIKPWISASPVTLGMNVIASESDSFFARMKFILETKDVEIIKDRLFVLVANDVIKNMTEVERDNYRGELSEDIRRCANNIGDLIRNKAGLSNAKLQILISVIGMAGLTVFTGGAALPFASLAGPMMTTAACTGIAGFVAHKIGVTQREKEGKVNEGLNTAWRETAVAHRNILANQAQKQNTGFSREDGIKGLECPSRKKTALFDVFGKIKRKYELISNGLFLGVAAAIGGACMLSSFSVPAMAGMVFCGLMCTKSVFS